MINLQDRMRSYDKPHCWQYDIRQKNLISDMDASGFSSEYVRSLRVSDFEFSNVADKPTQKEMIRFIEFNEWLGNISQYTTHWFACYHKDILSGVILFNMPNAFSKLLGENTPDLERLISRGACISWSPKNLASSFLMWCINWMVKNTQYRLFTAYSDTTARELGTIYQACNFFYLGKNAGSSSMYINPYSGRMVSDRFFRQKTAYKKYCGELGIEWQKNWSHKTGMNWKNIPEDISTSLREYSKNKQLASRKIEVPLKHKYAYVLGGTPGETKKLRKDFVFRNRVLPYPKDRNEYGIA